MSYIINLVIALLVKGVYRGKWVCLVFGMRRSGNHAFIGWMINSFEARNAPYEQDKDVPYFNATKSGEVIFFNELNCMGRLDYLQALFRKYLDIRKARIIILSFEDVNPEYVYDSRIPRFEEVIWVSRSVLNLAASRIQLIRTKLSHGKSVSGMSVDERFMSIVAAWKETPLPKYTWQYEKWLSDANYRVKFLSKFGLNADIETGMTIEGGGSSFNASQGKDKQDYMYRYREFQFPTEVVSLFQKEKYSDLFSESEKEYLEKLKGSGVKS